MSSLGARQFVDRTRWDTLARHSDEAWLAAFRTETPTERFCSPERWTLRLAPRTADEEREDYERHVRVAALLARVRAR